MSSAIHRQWKFEAPITSLCVNRQGDWVVASMGDGTAKLFPTIDIGEPKTVKLHDGVSLCLQQDADDHAFLSGGDDGKTVIIDPAVGEVTVLAEHKNQWVDHVAGSSDGKYRAYSIGKKVYVLDEEGKAKYDKPLELASSPGALSFSPNGKRLAASHYNGVSLWWMNSKNSDVTTLPWKGSHLDMIWSPDGKILLTGMQDYALHGWQIIDGKEMRMQGYAAKIRSMEFTAKGKYLATAGADQVICWPFFGGGPWGKAPMTLGGNDNRLVTRVAPHAKDEMVAAGYSDGMVILAPMDGRMEVMIHPPSAIEGNSINGLVWNGGGDALFASTESGTILLFTLDSVRKAIVQA